MILHVPVAFEPLIFAGVYPSAACLLLKILQSVDERYPLDDADADVILNTPVVLLYDNGPVAESAEREIPPSPASVYVGMFRTFAENVAGPDELFVVRDEIRLLNAVFQLALLFVVENHDDEV